MAKSGNAVNDKATKVIWDDSRMNTSYANVCNVLGSREEITLLFGANQAWHAQQQEVKVLLSDRVVLNPYAAKRLAAEGRYHQVGLEERAGAELCGHLGTVRQQHLFEQGAAHRGVVTEALLYGRVGQAGLVSDHTSLGLRQFGQQQLLAAQAVVHAHGGIQAGGRRHRLPGRGKRADAGRRGAGGHGKAGNGQQAGGGEGGERSLRHGDSPGRVAETES